MPTHVLALCARGAERALKREVERLRLPWAAGYQRPGLVTFRVDAPLREEALPALAFARARSVSLGRVDPPWSLEAIRARFGPFDVLRASAVEGATLPTELVDWAPGRPRAGDRVGELVGLGPGELWLGAHVHDASHSAHPGGIWPVEVPAEAPSRAWAKIEAVLDLWGRAPGPGERVLELGSAPGGTAWALLARGAQVVGVDPAAMDPRVLAHPEYRHVEGSIAVLPLERLPRRVDWLVSDMNVTPALTLRAAERLRSLAPHALVLTLKLNDWTLVDRLPEWLAEVRGWGYREVWARQLWPHRQELALAARR